MDRFFNSPPKSGVVRPLAVAVVWAYAAALAGGVVVGLAALIAGAVAAVAGIFNDAISVSASMEDTLRVAAWIAIPIVVGVAVWVAAYGATRQGSVPRAIVAAPVAVGTAIALYLLDSIGFLFAGLALGWALAVPAGSPTQVAARGLPLLVAALLIPGLEGLPGGWVILVVAVSPLIAALGVFGGQLPWHLGRRRLVS